MAKLLNDAVDQTRRAEHQQLQAEGDDTLKNTRYLWLHGQLPDTKQAGFAELLETLQHVARLGAQEGRLFVGLDALGDDREPQPVTQSDDRRGDDDVLVRLFEVHDEAAVDLDGVDRQSREV